MLFAAFCAALVYILCWPLVQRAKFTAFLAKESKVTSTPTPRLTKDAEDNDRERDFHPHALGYTIARIKEMLKKAVQYPKQFYKLT
jgi:hypothetical protein